MAYIVGLFIILALIFSYFGDYNLIGSITSQIKDKTIEAIIPKSEKEIAIENLDSENKVLSEFFSNSAPTILRSKAVPEKEKAAIQKAAEAFKSSQSLISNIQKLEKNDKSLTKTIIEKILNLSTNKLDESRPDPTNIPPQCRLECPGN